MHLLQFAVAWQRRSVDTHRVDDDVLRQQDLARIGIAGNAAALAAVFVLVGGALQVAARAIPPCCV